MAGLQWFRMDSGFPHHPKILKLLTERDGHRAAFVWQCGIAWTVLHGTDGVIPEMALPFIHARKVDAERLVAVGLWHVYPEGGWLVNGFDERQMTTDGKTSRSQAAREAANIRWHGRPDGPA
jgi:hypothetical protein